MCLVELNIQFNKFKSSSETRFAKIACNMVRKLCYFFVCLFACFRVGKEITPRDPVPQDIDLNLSNLYVLWGVRVNDSAPGMLLTHGGDVPAASLEQVNPAGQAGPQLDTPVSYRSSKGGERERVKE